MSSWHRAINCGSKAVEVQLGVGRSDGFGLEILSLEGLVGHSSGMVWCLLVLGVVVVVRQEMAGDKAQGWLRPPLWVTGV